MNTAGEVKKDSPSGGFEGTPKGRPQGRREGGQNLSERGQFNAKTVARMLTAGDMKNLTLKLLKFRQRILETGRRVVWVWCESEDCSYKAKSNKSFQGAVALAYVYSKAYDREYSVVEYALDPQDESLAVIARHCNIKEGRIHHVN